MKHLQDNNFASARDGKKLILVHRTKGADEIEYDLMKNYNNKCHKTHGDLTQFHREQATSSFNHGVVNVLVATTKLGGQGVNYDEVSDFIFWDPPDTLQEYMYYLGRVGCVGNKAKSTAFYSDSDYSVVVNKELLAFLEKYKQTVPANMAAALTLSKGNGGWGDAAGNSGEGSDAVGDDAGGDDADGDDAGVPREEQAGCARQHGYLRTKQEQRWLGHDAAGGTVNGGNAGDDWGDLLVML